MLLSIVSGNILASISWLSNSSFLEMHLKSFETEEDRERGVTPIDQYQRLPQVFRDSLQLVYEKQGKLGKGSPHRLIEVLNSLTPWQMLTDKWIHTIKCYSEDGRTIRLESFLKDSKSVKVLTGVLEGNNPRNVVVKYVMSRRHSVLDEINTYRNLQRQGCPCPWYTSDFYYWGAPVLVMEKLEPLGPYDNEYQVGRQILRQLKHVHRFGCHSDIKPHNIMKKRDPDKKRRYRYYLIDYGGLASKPLKEGYKRWIWTEKWSSQESHVKNQVVTPTNDFIELGYVMRAIQNWREQVPSKKSKYNDGNFKSGYRGRLKEYMHLVNKGCVSHRDLINVLKE